jgi:hypothetical protein
VPQPRRGPPGDQKVVRSITPGLLKVRWKANRGSQFYRLEMQEEGRTQWTVISTNKRVKHEVEGLQVSTAAGVSPMSEVVSQQAA